MFFSNHFIIFFLSIILPSSERIPFLGVRSNYVKMWYEVRTTSITNQRVENNNKLPNKKQKTSFAMIPKIRIQNCFLLTTNEQMMIWALIYLFSHNSFWIELKSNWNIDFNFNELGISKKCTKHWIHEFMSKKKGSIHILMSKINFQIRRRCKTLIISFTYRWHGPTQRWHLHLYS